MMRRFSSLTSDSVRPSSPETFRPSMQVVASITSDLQDNHECHAKGKLWDKQQGTCVSPFSASNCPPYPPNMKQPAETPGPFIHNSGIVTECPGESRAPGAATTCTFKCAPGYLPAGEAVDVSFQCDGAGLWRATAPGLLQCDPVSCGDPVETATGQLDATKPHHFERCQTGYDFGDPPCDIKCKEGYNDSPVTDTALRCGADVSDKSRGKPGHECVSDVG